MSEHQREGSSTLGERLRAAATMSDAYAVAQRKLGRGGAVRKHERRCQIGFYVGRDFTVVAEAATWAEAVGKILTGKDIG